LSEETLSVFWSIFIPLLGACLGSFGNVVIARYPAGLSIVTPRSRCPKCKSPIAWYDNIPILSFFILGRRCRLCRVKISWRYPLVELASALLFWALYLKLGLSYTLIEILIFAWAGLVASVIDLDHRILPDVFTLTGILVGLAGAALNPERGFYDALIGAIGGGGFLYLVAYVYAAIKNEEGMGGGDIKLIAWIGAVLGWKAVIFTILASSIFGSIIGLVYAAIQKSGLKTAIPFGPFLFGAALLYVFAGHSPMQVYLSYFFPFFD
jgi:leader peptidase (prepilin peptidase)/N-methyltransferase